ncbi:glycosyltransferase family A protein [Parasporobacterium paucivorans]|uniref:Glycosyltransferase involved in cell wall bisynthesis n=1 Tax=Parasporobacterium paucivorans DSM 15970 TaxID=1122934 RepID=A0A1M6H5I9_9FIRM|nr:glycosyltransferase family 2 protein [Parasporobacterium paucivorans]SHJ17412.1 Glycosyltransferase involved in cell wall bisynthesis [Parasporobacterium paucivorans DSM 15970]
MENIYTDIMGEVGEFSPVRNYFNRIREILSKEGNSKYHEEYLPIITRANAEKTKKIFLSVITRTQGKRPEALRETLLCLSGQTDMDFEVLIIGHKLASEGSSLVDDIIEEQETELKNRIRFLELDYGNRTTPLNYGFANAYGDYIAILDDDDLVFDNWVEEFHKAAGIWPGTVLHAYIFGQKWMTVETDKSTLGLRAVAKPNTDYCKDFILKNQLYMNVCPPVGLAFPANTFKKLGIIFDEDLDTTEDWDFFMRTVFVSGITDIKTATGIYRLWTNAESSATLHTQKEWAQNREVILQKFEKCPVALNEKWISECTHPGKFCNEQQSISADTRKNIIHPKLYYDDGKGFTEKNSISGENMDQYPYFSTEFQIPTDAKKLRFDVNEAGMVILKHISITITDIKGKGHIITMNEFRHNGHRFEDTIVYLEPDPQLVIDISSLCDPISIAFVGEVTTNISDNMIQYCNSRLKKSFFRKIISSRRKG